VQASAKQRNGPITATGQAFSAPIRNDWTFRSQSGEPPNSPDELPSSGKADRDSAQNCLTRKAYRRVLFGLGSFADKPENGDSGLRSCSRFKYP
jgi:hypothetical protein